MEKGFIILNRNLSQNEKENILNLGDFDIIEDNIIILKNKLKDHYTSIFECISAFIKKINNYEELDNILNQQGIIIVTNDTYVYETSNKKIAVIKIPNTITLISEKQIIQMENLYNEWINFNKLYLRIKLPKELSHNIISGYDNHNIKNNLYIIKLYLELAKKYINKKNNVKKNYLIK